MSKLFGTSVLSILVATVAFYMLGFLWYGYLFSDQWMHLTGITEAEATAMQKKLGAMMFVWGVLITLAQVLGLAAILNWSGTSKLLNSIKIATLITVLLILPVISYGALYEGISIHLIGIDFLHLWLGYILVAIILSLFKSK